MESDYKSTGGYVMTLNETVINWMSYKIKWAASPTCLSEL